MVVNSRSPDPLSCRYSIPSFLAIPEKFELAVRPLIQSTSSSPTSLSRPSPNQPSPPPPLAVSFTSASSFPLALPPTVALGFGITSFRRYWWGRLLGWAGVNERLRGWVQLHLQRVRTLELERQREGRRATPEKVPPALDGENEKADTHSEGPDLEKIRGWVLVDYVDSPNDLLPLLVECNYH
jgi:1-phosphatidylinositol phosphodiesterase